MATTLNSTIKRKIQGTFNLICLNVAVDAKTNSAAIRISQNATFSTYGCIRLLYNNAPINLLSESINAVSCIAKLPNGLSSTINCDINDDDTIIVKLSNASFIAQIGEVLCEIIVDGKNSDGVYRYTSLIFRLDVRA